MPETLRRVGRYEIVQEVGRGGMAVVYLARQTDLDRNVALKELAAFHASDRVFADRFVRESRVAGSLSHPNIVTVHDFFEHENIPFIAMEFIERGSLRQLMPRMTAPQVAGVLEAVLAGLAHAARHGVVHRDLKPENLMVTSEGTVKIADFGIARALNSLTARLTATGTAIGTPAYMAPEQATGDEIGPWTDLYSLGIVAYELLVGEVPFAYDEPMRILIRHVNDEIPPPREKRPDLDPQLSEWVEWLLRKDPKGRPRTAVEAWEALEEIVIGSLGPRWRRGARLTGDGAGVPTAHTPTPARFPGGTTGPSKDGDNARWAPTTESPELTPRAPAVATAAADGAAAGAPFAAPAEPTRPSAPPAERRRRMLVGVVAAAVVLAGLIAVAAVVLSGGSSSPKVSVLPDIQPKLGERIGLALAENSLFLSDPRGRVVRASGGLTKQVSISDASGPSALAVAGNRVYVADAKSVFALLPATLAPIEATAFDHGLALAAAPGSRSVVAVHATAGGGEVCEIAIGGATSSRCAKLSFAPAGVGAARGVDYVANSGAGTVVPYVARGKKLVPKKAIALGLSSKPSGTLVGAGGRLYVPVKRGLAVVVPSTGRVLRRVALPTTPTSISVTAKGTALAALYARNQIAVIANGAAPRFIKTGKGPVALAVDATGRTVYVVGGRTRQVEAISIGTGRVLRGPSGKLLAGGAASPTRLGAPKAAASGRKVTVSLVARGNALDKRSLRVRDPGISDGTASFQLLSGGLVAPSSTVSQSGLTIAVRPAPGGAIVSVRASPGAFVAMTTPVLGNHGVTFNVTKPAPTTTPTQSQPTTPSQTTPAPSTGGGAGITIG